MAQRVIIILGPEWERTVVALREADATFPGKVRKDLREKVRPLAQEVKGRVLALPTHGPKHTGLRAKVARGVAIRSGLGSGVAITTSMPHPNMAIIPRGLDSQTPERGWFHPVFGRGRVFQHGFSWFSRPLANHHDDIERDITHIIEGVRDMIARAS
jgi:hypothetical protein